MKSWRRLVNLLLSLILLFVLAVLFLLAGFFRTYSTNLLRTESENNLTVWMSMSEQRMNAMHANVYEILLTVYQNADIAWGGGPLSVQATVKCQELMENLLQINADADCFFLTDTETGRRLISAQNALKFLRTLELKEYIAGLDNRLAGSTSDLRWHLCVIDGETYILCLLKTGKYTAGALSRASVLTRVGEAGILPEGSSLLLAVPDGETYAISGEDWSGRVRFAEGRLLSDTRKNETCADFPLLGCKAVLIRDSAGFPAGVPLSALLLTGVALIFSLIALVTVIIFRKVAKPTRELLHAQEEIGAGNLDYRITAAPGSSEFSALYHSFNDMADQIRRLKIETYDNLLKEQKYRFQMVRAQIRPHFYLNSITVIHNMTYQNRLEDIRSYVQALARHIRYMLNIQNASIPVSAELSHIKNYIRMQDLRFPDSVKADYRCDERVGEVEIPFLILFTAVENAFKHAMNLYSPLELTITCEPYREEGFAGIRLIVEDNGDGFPEEVLAHFSGPMPEELPTKDHLGLSNVQYTLRYVYQRDGLLRLSNLAHGARTEILIPAEVKDG